MGLTYLDSCMLIYALEDSGPRGDRARERLANSPDRKFAISPLVRLECLIEPIRRNATRDVSRISATLEQFLNLKIDEPVFELATHMRARHGLKTPDALHAATAHSNECEAFWTNDSALLHSLPGVAVDVFDDL